MHKEVLDVCGRNSVVHLHGITRLGHDTALYRSALCEAFGPQANMAMGLGAYLESQYIDLEAYCKKLEAAVIATTGSAYGLYLVGTLSHEIRFATDSIRDLMKKWLGLLVNSPAVAMYEVPAIASTFNKNKWFRLLKAVANLALFQIEYIPLANGKVRSEVQDLGSLYYFVRGMMHGINLMWKQPEEELKPRYATLNLKPEDVLKFAAPDAKAEWYDHEFVINGQKHGELVHLVADKQGDFRGEYIGFEKNKPAHSRLGVKITKRFENPDTKGELKTVLWDNEVLRYQEPLANLLQLRWRTSWLRWPADAVMRPILSMSVKQDRRLALAQETAAVAEEQASTYRDVLAQSHPPGVLDQFFSGTLKSGRHPTLVLLIDMVGSTALRVQHTPEDYMNIITDVISDPLLKDGRAIGAYRYKLMGDGGISAIIDFEKRGLEHKVKDMLVFADKFMSDCEENGYLVRAGLAMGDVIWGNQTKEPGLLTWEGSGRAIDEASRLQSKGSLAGKKLEDGSITHGYVAISEQIAKIALKMGHYLPHHFIRQEDVMIANGDYISCYHFDPYAAQERPTAPGTASLQKRRQQRAPGTISPALRAITGTYGKDK